MQKTQRAKPTFVNFVSSCSYVFLCSALQLANSDGFCPALALDEGSAQQAHPSVPLPCREALQHFSAGLSGIESQIQSQNGLNRLPCGDTI